MAKIRQEKEVTKTEDQKIESQLDGKFTFDNFIKGNSNQSAYSAGSFVIGNPGEVLFNPLFIFGGSGLGKTHLVHAIGNAIKERFSNKNVLCFTSVFFCQQCIDAVESHSRDFLINSLQLVDILILEDIEYLSGETVAQEVLLAIFDTFCQKGKQILLSSDRMLMDMQGINPQLLSRFKGGLMVELQQPDYATRIAVLNGLLTSQNVEMSSEIITNIARNIKANLRELEECFHYLIAESQLLKKDITLEFAKNNINKKKSLVSEGLTINLANTYTNSIKAIGIGNVGCSIANYMHQQQISGVDFVVCDPNTEIIENNVVPNKIILENQIVDFIEQPIDLDNDLIFGSIFNPDTKIVLIIAGMGETIELVIASTIAELAKEREIITIGIVSIPFLSEGKSKYEKALLDINQLGKNVNSLLVIDTNKIKSLNDVNDFESGIIKINTAFTKIVKGVAVIVLHPKFDLKDLKTVLNNNRATLVGFSIVSGKNRAKKAIFSAMCLPWLRDVIITNATNILLLVTSGTTVMTIDEIGEINDYIQEVAGYKANIIMYVSEDINLGESLAVAIIASGYDVSE